MANTGRFFLFYILAATQEDAGEKYPQIREVRADCLFCHHGFTATAEPLLINIAGGGISVACSECGSRQSIAGARLADCRARTTESGIPVPLELVSPDTAAQLASR